MSAGLTPSEEMVAGLCERSFLSLWTHPNPVGKNGKELCDCLTVCGDDIIIISVKDIAYRDTGDAIGWERWQKAAIDASVKQIWGAERWLARSDFVVRKDGRRIQLPPVGRRRIHRLAVSLGGRGDVPMRWGDFGHGFVHVLEEYSLVQAFRELDTITDFVSYLRACEGLFEGEVKLVFDGGGPEDLLALYVRHGPSFGLGGDRGQSRSLLVVQHGLWQDLVTSPEYLARQADLKSSYAWDKLIEHFVADLLTGGMFDMHNKQATTDEHALVEMARQPRCYRASLADAFVEFLSPACAKVAARLAIGANATAFVFLTGDHEGREGRASELGLRCLVVRGRHKGVTTVIGIATDRPRPGRRGHSNDILYLHLPEWTAADTDNIARIQAEFGYFENTRWPE